MLTKNEIKILRFLMTSFNHYSINEIARECKLTPKGAYNILKKFERADVLKFNNIGKIKAYKINFSNPLTANYLRVALTDERINEAKIKVRVNDFKEIKKVCSAAIIFGSYITDKKVPNDIDILFIFDKPNFNNYKKELEKIKEIIPYKIHDIIQTQEDIVSSLRKQDKVIINVVRTGLVLWGHDIVVESIKNAQTR